MFIVNCTNLLNHIQYLSFDKNGIEEKYILGLTLIILIAGFKPEAVALERGYNIWKIKLKVMYKMPCNNGKK